MRDADAPPVDLSATVCRACAFIGRDNPMQTPRAAFFHALRHRDAGHAIDAATIDALDPDEPPDAIPREEKCVTGTRENLGNANSYADKPKAAVVGPERLGRPRGRSHGRLGRYRGALPRGGGD